MNAIQLQAALCVVVSLLLGGCISTTPRPYAAVLAVPATDNTAYGTAFWGCSQRVAKGDTHFGPSKGSIVVGQVATAAAATSLTDTAIVASMGGDVALSSTGIGLMVTVPVAMYRFSYEKRKSNEAGIQRAMTDCLAAEGFLVSRWDRVAPKDLPSYTLVTPTQHMK